MLLGECSMKMFTKLALVSSMAVSANAMAMQSMDDAALSAATGQDGINIGIGISKIEIAKVLVHDNDGLVYSGTAPTSGQAGFGGTGNAGAIVIKSNASGKTATNGIVIEAPVNAAGNAYDTTRKLTGWYKNEHKSKEWLKIKYKFQPKGCQVSAAIQQGPGFTPDHRIFTQRGYVEIEDIVSGEDRVLVQECAYSEDTMQVILGSLLGDGALSSKNGKGAGFVASQADSRRDYLELKAASVNARPIKTLKGWRIATEYNYQLTDLYHELEVFEDCRVYRPKPTQEYLSRLDARALAIWYFDDGNLPPDSKPRLWSRTLAKHPEYVQYVLDWMQQLGIKAHFHTDEVNNQFFVIDSELEFFNLIRKYATDSVQYKIRDAFKDKSDTYLWDFSRTKQYYALVEDVVQWEVPESRRGYSTSWCIDVENNHNFFTPIGLVHNCRDTAATLELHNKFLPIINNSRQLSSCYYNLMLPALMFLTDMEDRGIPISKDRLVAARGMLEAELDDLRTKLYSFPEVVELERDQGKIFNPNSVNQLRVLLYDKLGLDNGGALTDTGALSTDSEVLTELAKQHEIASVIHEIRKKTKLLSTYVVKLMGVIDRDNRVRTGFNLTSTTSGRLSSSGNFNVQQLPRDNPLIKGCVKARPGYKIVAVD